MSRKEQQTGEQGQKIAASYLRQAGVNMVEKIATPVKLIASQHKGYFRVVYGETVSGDHRGLLDDGTSVLAETKTILDRNLRYSDLREHQPGRLTEHAEHNGLSILVWVHFTSCYIMRWPIDGFEHGTSITPEEAEALHIRSFISKSKR